MAAGIFVAVDDGHRKETPPAIRNVLRCLRPDLLEHVRIDTDISDADAAAVLAPRHQQMRRLAAEEGNGLDRVDRSAHHRARRAADPARQADGEPRPALCRCVLGYSRGM